MPELRWYFGYPLVWLVMIGMAGGILLFFKRRRWLQP
jgi:magnesium transporter